MPRLHLLRQTRLIARCVLVWFALAMAAAIASPIVQPQAMELVCSTGGGLKLIVKGDDGSAHAQLQMQDCPMCILGGAPPPDLAQWLPASQRALSHVLRPVPAAHIAWLTAAPLPARGPPAFS